MRIDSNYVSTAASSADEQRAHSTSHEMEPQDSSNTGPIQQGGSTGGISPTVAVSRTARPPDTANISGAAPHISDLATAVHTGADVRHAKVQSLREAVEQGTYQVSPERIAESMLAQATSKLR